MFCCVSLCWPEKTLRVHGKDFRKLAGRLEDYKLLVVRKRDASTPSQGGEMLASCKELRMSFGMINLMT